MINIAFVPVKGVSTRTPYKNHSLLAAHLAKLSNHVQRIVVITDDQDLATIAFRHNCIVVPEPAGDNTYRANLAEELIIPVCNKLGISDDVRIVYCEVTHTGVKDIVYTRVLNKEGNVVLVNKVQHPLTKLFTITDGKLTYPSGHINEYVSASQLHEPSYLPAGIIAVKLADIKAQNSLYVTDLETFILDEPNYKDCD